MPGAIVISTKDLVVNDIPARNTATASWNNGSAGRGVFVVNSYKDHPAAGQGDPTVQTNPSNAFYMWTGSAFVKMTEGESMDKNFKREYFSGNGAQTQFNISEAGTVHMVEVAGQILEPVAGAEGYQVAGQVVTIGFAPVSGQRIGIYFYN